jgi:hypothetical protein
MHQYLDIFIIRRDKRKIRCMVTLVQNFFLGLFFFSIEKHLQVSELYILLIHIVIK